MHTLYVGDARSVRKRVRQHVTCNVEASALRKHLAARKGYGIARTRRASGSYRKRLDLPDPKRGEAHLMAYLRAGHWHTVPCRDYDEANALQWHLIARLAPLLNADRRPPDAALATHFDALWATAAEHPPAAFDQLTLDVPGVYVLYHDTLPEEDASPERARLR